MELVCERGAGCRDMTDCVHANACFPRFYRLVVFRFLCNRVCFPANNPDLWELLIEKVIPHVVLQVNILLQIVVEILHDRVRRELKTLEQV